MSLAASKLINKCILGFCSSYMAPFRGLNAAWQYAKVGRSGLTRLRLSVV